VVARGKPRPGGAEQGNAQPERAGGGARDDIGAGAVAQGDEEGHAAIAAYIGGVIFLILAVIGFLHARRLRPAARPRLDIAEAAAHLGKQRTWVSSAPG
jgi:hypothetical protein